MEILCHIEDRECFGKKVEVLCVGSARMVETEMVSSISSEERQCEWSGLFPCHCEGLVFKNLVDIWACIAVSSVFVKKRQKRDERICFIEFMK
ncbi:hypothetical protein CEXT_419991 [Caerostris extrusa]|uniref:Uncharacterized protein n=1 Tax=Caerostris extrusa TaxID=172846 RepID=A0AAV4XDI0_CAEEX|nr:hypothetical protein CEXT_419991 [Caerostris extrusa]